MAEALYRKYRPQVFNDMVGQEHIERTIKNAIVQDKVSHAYLFTGPRGTGKTTTARLLAKALLCDNGPTATPDGTCKNCIAIANSNHPDVYELDAASRTGVDNVREEIIGRVQYAPTRGRYKIYIIDEVHMLSTAAFNALLKTLEEPPEHVVFILCTTDPQKVPETIHSRCQRFDFRRISTEAIVSRLGAVCVSEGVEFEGEALDVIAHRAEGGMRNALTSLEQLIAFGEGKVTLEVAERLLGSLDSDSMADIVAAIGKRDAAACFTWTAQYVETGADLAQFVRDLAEHVRDLYILSLAGADVDIDIPDATRTTMVRELEWFGTDRLSRMLTVLGDVNKELRTSSNPRLAFEIALTRMIRPESDYTIEALAERVESLEAQVRQLKTQTAHAAIPQSAPAVQEAQETLRPLKQATPASMPAASLSAMSASPSAPSTTPAPAAPVMSDAHSSAHSPNAAGSNAPASSTNTVVATTADTHSPDSSTSSSVSGSMIGTVNTADPSALQRFWRSVTTRLRKANPARGVLFMNTQIAPNPAGGIVIVFASDNSFAFNASQKTEVRQLLTQTMAEVAGAPVPYEYTLASSDTPQNTNASAASAPPNSRFPEHASSVPFEEDMPPVDIYESYASSYNDATFHNAEPAYSAPQPEHQPSAASMQKPQASASKASQQEQQVDAQLTSQPQSPQSPAQQTQPASKGTYADVTTLSPEEEKQQVQDILRESFGLGVRFQDVD